MNLETIDQLIEVLLNYRGDSRILATSESCCTKIGDVYMAADGTVLIDVDPDPGGQYKEFFMSGRLEVAKRMEPPLRERGEFS